MNLYCGIGVRYFSGDYYDVLKTKRLPQSKDGEEIAVLRFNPKESLSGKRMIARFMARGVRR